MWRPNERMVTLHDGRQVSNYSEAWRHECEAMHILNMPTLAERRACLYGVRESKRQQNGTWHTFIARRGVLQTRGEAEVKRIEATMTALWKRRQSKFNNHPRQAVEA